MTHTRKTRFFDTLAIIAICFYRPERQSVIKRNNIKIKWCSKCNDDTQVKIV